ncbi:hypothetical protein EXIGLDRAFT_701034 [Exidia glandulosa HHB12029]|uniref:F-box domain-containing protein n=1 Tax=Exidia glandulosa HHB12029 TaxID=1314781 RepID=A0A165D5W4_EXIGL|nr:hypothetical protein EXIGLDRAFT_701034 [Exidia glandulosa HHB12029]
MHLRFEGLPSLVRRTVLYSFTTPSTVSSAPQPLDVVHEIVWWLAQGYSTTRGKRLLRFAGTAKSARVAALPLVLRTVAFCISTRDQLQELDRVCPDFPTRTLLLAIPVLSVPSQYANALRWFQHISSLAIVSLPTNDDAVTAGNTANAFSAILRAPSLQAKLQRLSLACNLAEPLCLGDLHLQQLARLTELRLALQATQLTVSPTCRLPDTIHTLCLSPAVVVASASVDLALPVLSSLSVAMYDRSEVSWPGDHGFAFPTPAQPAVVALGSAFKRLVGKRKSLTDISLEDIEVNAEMLDALVLLPNLTRLSVHPGTEYDVLSSFALTEDDAIRFLASNVLRQLTSLKVLHLGTLAFSLPCQPEDWANVKTALPASCQVLVAGRCDWGVHSTRVKGVFVTTLQAPTAWCRPRAFDWANDEQKDLLFRNPVMGNMTNLEPDSPRFEWEDEE